LTVVFTASTPTRDLELPISTPVSRAELGNLLPDLLALAAFLSLVLVLAMLRFKKRLD